VHTTNHKHHETKWVDILRVSYQFRFGLVCKTYNNVQAKGVFGYGFNNITTQAKEVFNYGLTWASFAKCVVQHKQM
jgi:hypothetical protein